MNSPEKGGAAVAVGRGSGVGVSVGAGTGVSVGCGVGAIVAVASGAVVAAGSGCVVGVGAGIGADVASAATGVDSGCGVEVAAGAGAVVLVGVGCAMDLAAGCAVVGAALPPQATAIRITNISRGSGFITSIPIADLIVPVLPVRKERGLGRISASVSGLRQGKTSLCKALLNVNGTPCSLRYMSFEPFSARCLSR